MIKHAAVFMVRVFLSSAEAEADSDIMRFALEKAAADECARLGSGWEKCRATCESRENMDKSVEVEGNGGREDGVEACELVADGHGGVDSGPVSWRTREERVSVAVIPSAYY